MSKRNEHLFRFTGEEIGKAAESEADYHADRIGYWEKQMQNAKTHVEATVAARLVEVDVTGGKEYTVIVDYGDPAAMGKLQLAQSKIRTHRNSAERYRIDARTYLSQSGATFDLDGEDVRHFRLGGDPRED